MVVIGIFGVIIGAAVSVGVGMYQTNEARKARVEERQIAGREAVFVELVPRFTHLRDLTMQAAVVYLPDSPLDSAIVDSIGNALRQLSLIDPGYRNRISRFFDDSVVTKYANAVDAAAQFQLSLSGFYEAIVRSSSVPPDDIEFANEMDYWRTNVGNESITFTREASAFLNQLAAMQ